MTNVIMRMIRMKFIMSIKNITVATAILVLCVSLTGCGSSDTPDASDRTSGASSSVEDVLQQGMAEADAQSTEQKVVVTPDSYNKDSEDGSTDQSETTDQVEDQGYSFDRQTGISAGAPDPEEVAKDVLLSSTEGIDVDLTMLSSTMVYSQVYDMMAEPEKYIGQTIRMSGMYSSFYDETLDKHYFACIIQDATACCAQGIEFELTDDYSYPDDYPEEDDLITVTGVFDTYMEGESMYVTLRNAYMG
ncbi:MAG: hypothetical protein K6F54_01940 [Lachnospiraceae bacterium]|nr:hypothetical protein [Lachnospiraceae bacterium]